MGDALVVEAEPPLHVLRHPAVVEPAFVAVAENLLGAAVAGDDHEAAVALGVKQIEVLVGALAGTAADGCLLVEAHDGSAIEESLGFLESLLFADGLGAEPEHGKQSHKS